MFASWWWLSESNHAFLITKCPWFLWWHVILFSIIFFLVLTNLPCFLLLWHTQREIWWQTICWFDVVWFYHIQSLEGFGHGKIMPLRGGSMLAIFIFQELGTQVRYGLITTSMWKRKPFPMLKGKASAGEWAPGKTNKESKLVKDIPPLRYCSQTQTLHTDTQEQHQTSFLLTLQTFGHIHRSYNLLTQDSNQIPQGCRSEEPHPSHLESCRDFIEWGWPLWEAYFGCIGRFCWNGGMHGKEQGIMVYVSCIGCHLQ